VPDFIAIDLRGASPQICEILRCCDFFVVLSCPVLVNTFFSQSRPGRTPGRILTAYGLNDACLLGVLITTHNFQGFKSLKKGAWLGIFQPNSQNHKIAISPTAKIGSTPNFDMSDFKAKMYQIQFRLGLCPRPRWGAYSAPPDLLAGLRGPTSNGMGGNGKGRGGERREGEGKSR